MAKIAIYENYFQNFGRTLGFLPFSARSQVFIFSDPCDWRCGSDCRDEMQRFKYAKLAINVVSRKGKHWFRGSWPKWRVAILLLLLFHCHIHTCTLRTLWTLFSSSSSFSPSRSIVGLLHEGKQLDLLAQCMISLDTSVWETGIQLGDQIDKWYNDHRLK